MHTLEWTTEKRKVSELIPYQNNPRQLTEKQAKDLSTSLERFNLADPIVINTDNTIIGGHQRVSIVKKAGVLTVDVRVPSRTLTKDELLELNLRLNRNQGQWDFDLLANLDEELLTNVGFDSKELDKIFQLDTTPEDDSVPVTRITDIRLGDLFQLGENRLLCGDATQRDAVEKLMQGEKADMVFTDPPYNVRYEGMSKQWIGLKNDNLPKDGFIRFLLDTFTNVELFTLDAAGIYVCHADKTQIEFRTALEEVGYEWRATIVWVKNQPAFNMAQYKYKHEPIYYMFKKGNTVKWYGDANETTVWDIKRASKNEYHSTQKPVELVEMAVINSSPREGVVMDLFGGSGSTLIACEKTNRKCRMMEIDPTYVQVIIDRWEKFTGKKAVQLNTV